MAGGPATARTPGTSDRVQQAAWLLLAATSTLYFLGTNEADNDLWVHLLVGCRIAGGWFPVRDDLSYTAAGTAWIDHEWLAHAALGLLWELGGARALWLAKASVGIVAAACLWRQAGRSTAEFWIRGSVLVLVLAVLGRGFAVRPQIVTYAATALLLGWLHARPGTTAARDVLVAAVAMGLWANAHGGFVAGLGLLGLWAVMGGRRRTAWALPAAAAAATLLNPYGWRLPAYVAREIAAAHPTTEWLPVHPGDPAQWPFLLLVAMLALTAPWGRLVRRHPWHAAALVAATLLALRHQRHTPLVAILAAAPLADQVDAIAGRLRGKIALSAPARWILIAGIAGIAAVQLARAGSTIGQAGAGLRFRAEEYPVGAVRYLRAAGLEGNAAVPLDWGSYVLWHAWPDVRVSLDGRFVTVYPASVVSDVFAYFAGRERNLLDRYPTGLVIAPAGTRHAAASDPAWRLAYRDEVAEVFVRGERGREPAVARAFRGWMPFP